MVVKRPDLEKIERESARAIKAINKSYPNGIYGGQVKEASAWPIIWIVLGVLLFSSLLLNKAHAYSNEEIVNAIYHAEGGKKAKYKYGIRSVSYSNEKEARKICLNTVRNNRKRFADYGHRQYSTFIEFLGSRYCPTKGALTQAEKRLNPNWVRNVEFFLAKGGK